VCFFYEKFSLALKMIQKALELDAARSVIWLQLGYCQQALGMIAVAGESFVQARELDPRCVEATMAQRQLAVPGGWERVRSWWRRLTN
jgi:Flp pilus assembly protein TadD